MATDMTDEDRYRLVRVSTDLLPLLDLRTADGRWITAEWGEPDADGIYEPTFTAHENPGIQSARTNVRTVRPYHRAEPDSVERWRCSVCGSGIHRATYPGKSPLTFWRHDPGTVLR